MGSAFFLWGFFSRFFTQMCVCLQNGRVENKKNERRSGEKAEREIKGKMREKKLAKGGRGRGDFNVFFPSREKKNGKICAIGIFKKISIL